jgi:uncharacterized protein (DUF697 family)
MKVKKVIAALVFGMFLALGSVIGVSAQDDTMKPKQTDTTQKDTKMMKTKSRRHMTKKHHTMKKRNMMKKRSMMKKKAEAKTG